MSKQVIKTRLNELISPQLKKKKKMKVSDLKAIHTLVDTLCLTALK